MADIFHDLPIRAPLDRVFRAISNPGGLDTWWTKRSAGSPVEGTEYTLSFGPERQWRGVAPSVRHRPPSLSNKIKKG